MSDEAYGSPRSGRPCSMRMNRRDDPEVALRSSTACPVVPDPANGSITSPVGGHHSWMIFSKSMSGFTVSKPWPRPTMAFSSLRPVSVVPDCSCCHDTAPQFEQVEVVLGPEGRRDDTFLHLFDVRLVSQLAFSRTALPVGTPEKAGPDALLPALQRRGPSRLQHRVVLRGGHSRVLYALDDECRTHPVVEVEVHVLDAPLLDGCLHLRPLVAPAAALLGVVEPARERVLDGIDLPSDASVPP